MTFSGNFYYLDFGDSHVWGHAALSFVAFGTLSLFSASVSQCLFPSIKPWIFVFTQIILLVICCFIAMFWVDDPTLSIGLMVVPQTDSYPTQTSGGSVNSPSGAPATSAAAATTYNASTSTTALPLAATASGQPGQSTALSSNGMTFALASDPSRTSAGLANVALANNVMNSAMASTSALSSATTAVGGGGGVGRTSLQAKRTATMSSVNEKQGYVDQEDGREWYGVGVYEESEEAVVSASVPASATSSDYGVVKDEMGHLSLKME
ncbi:hypothetical protein EDD21DRAFT_353189 [Dissophora ornata]|nr:hypothetical protein EDD21DRAFT_353189 [Dissophora ornata]